MGCGGGFNRQVGPVSGRAGQWSELLTRYFQDDIRYDTELPGAAQLPQASHLHHHPTIPDPLRDPREDIYSFFSPSPHPGYVFTSRLQG